MMFKPTIKTPLFSAALPPALYIFMLSFLGVPASAQIEPMLRSTTRAVIVGISNYENISNLKFAHRDAEAFSQYLRSPAGGNVPEDHIKLLTNEKATAGQIGLAFNWLVKESEAEDKAIIYFSGHGDVESESSDLGYLLAHDAQKTTYMGSGTIAIFALEHVVKKLSEKKQAEVILIADACHAGNLAGSEINGTKLMANALSGELPNVAKIMSCQPEEKSQEDEIWGGGHSVFSYFLLKGLNGFADLNENREITLREIEGFLYDSVQHSTVSQGFRPQSPKTYGDYKKVLARVDIASFTALKNKQKAPEKDVSTAVSSKNAGVMDTITLRLYQQFEKALRTGHLLYPEQDAAYSIYQEIKDRPAIQSQIEMMRYALAAAMQDDAQKAINDYLSADPREMRQRWALDDNRYRLYPQYLEKAAELLGKDNFAYTQLKTREFYFTGLNLRLQGERNDYDTMLFKSAISFQEKALQLDSNAPYAYNELGLLARRLDQYEASVVYFNKALHFSPNWVLPWANLCGSYCDLGQLEQAEKCGLKAIKLDSTFALSHYNLGYVYFEMGAFEKAIISFQKTIITNPDYTNAYDLLGHSYYRLKDFTQAELIWKKLHERKPNDPNILQNLGEVGLDLGRGADYAEPLFLKAIALDISYPHAYLSLGKLHLEKNEYALAQKRFAEFSALRPENGEVYFYRAIAAHQDSTQALQYLETAFQKGFKDYESLKKEPRLDALRKLAAYKELIKQNGG